MDAAQALADLTEISSQIEAAVLFDGGGAVLGSTVADDERSADLVGAANELLAAAADVQPGEALLTQLEVSTLDGSVFVVSDGDRRIVATTGPEPTVGLVFYDLKSCLRGVAEEPPRSTPKRARRKKKDPEADGDAA
jgi:predicted regulator of Ras-like GTPase activity (Roadblock/LC7/MglB family)